MTLQQLIDRRRAEGATIEELAKLAGITRAGLFKLRRGRVRCPRPATIPRLAKALRTTPAVLRKAMDLPAV